MSNANPNVGGGDNLVPVYPVGHKAHTLVFVDRQSRDYAPGMESGMRRGTVTPRAGAQTLLERVPRSNPQIAVSVVTVLPDGQIQTIRPSSVMALSEAGRYVMGDAPADPVPVIDQPVNSDPAEEASEQAAKPMVDRTKLNSLLLSRVTAPAPVAPPPAAPPPVAPQPTAATATDMRELFAGFMQMLAAGSTPPSAPVAQPQPVMPQPVPQPVVPAPPAAPAPAPPPLDGQLGELLEIPNLGATPRAPKLQVDFISQQANFRHTAFYHWVMREGSDLILAADARYDYPFWCPPEMGTDTEFRVTVHAAEGAQTYTCLLLGLNFSFGVFRFYQLVRTDAEPRVAEQEPTYD